MPGAFSIGDWRVDPSLHSVSGAAGEVRLEPKVMQVLVELTEHAGQVVTKERLLHTVWADTFVGDEVLSRAISELRRVLGDDPKAPRFIQTIPKGGYRLVAPVRFDEPSQSRRVTHAGRRVRSAEQDHAVGPAAGLGNGQRCSHRLDCVCAGRPTQDGAERPLAGPLKDRSVHQLPGPGVDALVLSRRLSPGV